LQIARKRWSRLAKASVDLTLSRLRWQILSQIAATFSATTHQAYHFCHEWYFRFASKFGHTDADPLTVTNSAKLPCIVHCRMSELGQKRPVWFVAENDSFTLDNGLRWR